VHASTLAGIVRRYDQIPWLRRMRDIIRSWWGVEVIYIDREDQPTFLPGQATALPNRVCAIALGDRAARARCLECIRQARRDSVAMEGGGPQISLGCHLGQLRLTLPIRPEDRDGGMLYTTGFFDHELSDEERERWRESAAAQLPELGHPGVLESAPALSAPALARLAEMLELGGAAVVTLYGELRSKEEEIATLRGQLADRQGMGGLVGSASGMQEVYQLIERVAQNDCTVLVRGESGTGKELVANAIHGQSPRAGGPFVVQNCSAFNDNLLESELFGHVRGAFTGAVADKKGLFEIADGGSLFLDEVAEMSPALQAKLLRVLQDHTFWPVGATQPRSSDVRIIAATHRGLETMVKEGSFREDLYYRLNVISIQLPALRERRGDIPTLAGHFLGRCAGGARLTPDALRLLCDYDWPGNVRELANEMERISVLGAGRSVLERDLLSPHIVQAGGPGAGATGSLRDALTAVELQMIRSALEQCQGNRSQAAKLLGIARSNLLVKMKTFGLS
jgi:two-component system, NtrC family, response regulator HupR/HoxA